MTLSHQAESPTASADPPERQDEASSAGWTVALVVVAVLVGAAGFALRARFLLSEVGFLNSDEATTGFMAFDILRGHLPVLVEGNPYGGPLESYLLAPFLALLGSNEVFMQLANLAIWVLATVLCYGVARLVVPRIPAVAAALVLWVSGAAMILLSIEVYAGYASGIAAYLGAFLVAGRLADVDEPSPWWSLLAGFLAGTAVWLHPMFLFLVGPALAVVTVRHWRSWMAWLVPAAAGAVLALVPTIVLNAANDWFSLEQPEVIPPLSYRERLEQFVAQLWPRTLGLRSLAGEWTSGYAEALYIGLLALIVAGLVVLLVRRGWSGRMLAVVGFASPLLLAFLEGLNFYGDGRYGINFMPIFAIAALTAVWAGLRRWATAARVVVLAVPIAWLAVLAVPSVDDTIDQVTAAITIKDDDVDAVIARLEEAGIRDLRGTYWLAYRIGFRAEDELDVAMVGGPVRFPREQRRVDAVDPRVVAYVAETGQPPPFDERSLPADQYVAEVIGGLVLYLPIPSPG